MSQPATAPSAPAGRDTIADFTTGDKIDLSAIDANGEGPGNTAFTFGTGAFTAAGQIRVLAAGANRYGVYLETTGNNRRGRAHHRLFRPRPDRGGFRAVAPLRPRIKRRKFHSASPTNSLRSSHRRGNALELSRILPDLELTSIQDGRKGRDFG